MQMEQPNALSLTVRRKGNFAWKEMGFTECSESCLGGGEIVTLLSSYQSFLNPITVVTELERSFLLPLWGHSHVTSAFFDPLPAHLVIVTIMQPINTVVQHSFIILFVLSAFVHPLPHKCGRRM